MYTTTINNQAFLSKKPLLMDFFANEATQSYKRIIEYLVTWLSKNEEINPTAEYIARDLEISERTVFRCLAKIKKLGFIRTIRDFNYGKQVSSRYYLAPWAQTKEFISFLARHLHKVRRLTSVIVFGVSLSSRYLDSVNTKKEMSDLTFYRFNLLNLKKDIILPMRILSKKETKKGVSMYPPDKPDYIKTFANTKKPQQREEPKTSTRRYPVYVPEPPKQRNYKEDCERVVQFLASNDPKDKDAHNFLNFLDPETKAKLIYNKFIQKPE